MLLKLCIWVGYSTDDLHFRESRKHHEILAIRAVRAQTGKMLGSVRKEPFPLHQLHTSQQRNVSRGHSPEPFLPFLSLLTIREMLHRWQIGSDTTELQVHPSLFLSGGPPKASVLLWLSSEIQLSHPRETTSSESPSDSITPTLFLFIAYIYGFCLVVR